MFIQILTWHDTVSKESAENGDFESTGNAMMPHNAYSLTEAAQLHAELLEGLGYYEYNGNFASDVAYAADPDINYASGAKDTRCVAVLFPDDTSDRAKDVYNKLVHRAIRQSA